MYKVFLVLCRSLNYLTRKAAVYIRCSLSSRSLCNSAKESYYVNKVFLVIHTSSSYSARIPAVNINCSLFSVDPQATQQGELLCV